MARSGNLCQADPEIYESWSCSGLNIVKLHHIWTIQNFRTHSGPRRFRSARFGNGGHDRLEWSLELCTDNKSSTGEGCVSLFLRLNSCQKSPVRAGCNLSLLDAGHKLIGSVQTFRPHEFREGDRWGFVQMVEPDQLKAHLDTHASDNLVVSCELTAALEFVEVSSQNLTPQTRSLDITPSENGFVAGARTFFDDAPIPTSEESSIDDEDADLGFE